MSTLISRIRLFRLNIPLISPFVISLETITHAENVAVCIETGDGLTGWGECSPYRTIIGETQATGMAVGRELARLLIGKDALETEACLQALDRHITGNLCIKSAFDIALLDLAAQVAGLPLYRFLGGSPKELVTDMTVGIGTPEAMAAEAARFYREGFHAIKVKLGTTTAADVARIRAIRESIGPEAHLSIDANQGWDLMAAVQTLQALAPFGISYCEAPLPAWDDQGYAEVRRQSPVPIMADESLFDHHDALRLIRMGACDAFNIKLAKSGGIVKALKIAAIAEGAGVPCQVGCFSESRLAITATAHLAASRANIRYFDLDSPLMLAEDPVEGGVTYLSGGKIHLPEKPGLGAAFTLSALPKTGTLEIT